jgi:hypothetical protein
VEQLIVPSYETTIATWTATVVIDNPDHWPVETYVGVAFMRRQPSYLDVSPLYGSCTVDWGGWITPGMEGVPEWALQPGLQAIDQNDRIRTVSERDLLLPKHVAVPISRSGSIPRPDLLPGSVCEYSSGFRWWPVLFEVGGVVRFSRLGPTYIATPDGGERFEPRMMMPRLIFSTIYQTYYSTTTTFTWSCDITNPLNCSYVRTTISRPISTSSTTSISDIRDNQFATFPYRLQAATTGLFKRIECGYHVTYTGGCRMVTYHLKYIIYYRLVYIKVVDMWNVTNILAYHTPENPEDTTIRVKADGPLGIAAIYVYDSSDVTPLPPPPRPRGIGRPPPEDCIAYVGVNVCISEDVGDKMTPTKTSETLDVKCKDGVPKNYRMDAEFTTSDPDNCDAFMAPSPGTYTTNEVQPCDKEGNKITCKNVPPGKTIILDCDH